MGPVEILQLQKKTKNKRRFLSKKASFAILLRINPIVAFEIDNRKIYIISNTHIIC